MPKKATHQHQTTTNLNGMDTNCDTFLAKHSNLLKKMKQPTVNFNQNLKKDPTSNNISSKNYKISRVNQEGEIKKAENVTKLTPSPVEPTLKVEPTPNPSLMLATQHHPIPPPPIKPKRKKQLKLPKHFNCKQISDHFKPVIIHKEQAVKRDGPPGKT